VFPLVSFVAIGVNCCLMIVMAVSGFAIIYSKSTDINATLRSRHVDTFKRSKDIELKWRNKFYASLQPLKIKIGPTNFVEPGTPIILLNGAVDIAVNLLLLNA